MQTATNDAEVWKKIPRLQRNFTNPEIYEAHCAVMNRILSTAESRRAAARRETPPLRVVPAPRREIPALRTNHTQRLTITPDQTAEVVDPEDAMLKRAKQLFSASPGLKQTYGTAEAFARTCMKANRNAEQSRKNHENR